MNFCEEEKKNVLTRVPNLDFFYDVNYYYYMYTIINSKQTDRANKLQLYCINNLVGIQSRLLAALFVPFIYIVNNNIFLLRIRAE